MPQVRRSRDLIALQAKGDDATLNSVVQHHGIAYDWHTLTDALGRALIANWSTASRAAGMPGVGTQVRGGTQSGRPVDSGRAGEVQRRLPAFPGEREAAGLDRPAPGNARQTPPVEEDGQMRLLEPESLYGARPYSEIRKLLNSEFSNHRINTSMNQAMKPDPKSFTSSTQSDPLLRSKLSQSLQVTYSPSPQQLKKLQERLSLCFGNLPGGIESKPWT